MHLPQKGFVKKYLCWYKRIEPYILHDTIIEMMIGSTSSSSNVHEVVDDNSNPYMNMYGCDENKLGSYRSMSNCSEEPNANTTMFFDLLKDSNEPL